MHLLILSASARFMCHSAIRAGHSISSQDLFVDRDFEFLRAKHPNSVLSVQKLENFDQPNLEFSRSDVDGVVIGGGIENRPPIVETIQNQFCLLGTQAKQLIRMQQSDSFDQVAEMVAACGGRVPPTIPFDPLAQLDGHWLIKNLAGAGGTHVCEATSATLKRHSPSGPTWVLQRKITGEPFSTVFVAGPDECVVLGSTQLLLGQAPFGGTPFGYCGSIGPVELPSRFQKILRRLGAALAREFEIKGVFGIDWLMNDSGLWLVDINPRIPASAEILETARWGSSGHSLSLMGLHVAACLAHPPEQERDHSPSHFEFAVGKAILFSRVPQPYLVRQQQSDSLSRLLSNQVSCFNNRQRWVADVPNPGTTVNPGDPVISIFVKGAGVSDTKKQLEKFAAELRKQIQI